MSWLLPSQADPSLCAAFLHSARSRSHCSRISSPPSLSTSPGFPLSGSFPSTHSHPMLSFMVNKQTNKHNSSSILTSTLASLPSSVPSYWKITPQKLSPFFPLLPFFLELFTINFLLPSHDIKTALVGDLEIVKSNGHFSVRVCFSWAPCVKWLATPSIPKCQGQRRVWLKAA